VARFRRTTFHETVCGASARLTGEPSFPISCPRFETQLEGEKVVLLLSLHQILRREATINSGHKGKAVPLQACSGPEGSTKLRFPDFMTTAQDGGKVVRPTHRPPLPPGNTPGTHFC
jgi:hypothetical protein